MIIFSKSSVHTEVTLCHCFSNPYSVQCICAHFILYVLCLSTLYHFRPTGSYTVCVMLAANQTVTFENQLNFTKGCQSSSRELIFLLFSQDVSELSHHLPQFNCFPAVNSSFISLMHCILGESGPFQMWTQIRLSPCWGSVHRMEFVPLPYSLYTAALCCS